MKYEETPIKNKTVKKIEVKDMSKNTDKFDKAIDEHKKAIRKSKLEIKQRKLMIKQVRIAQKIQEG